MTGLAGLLAGAIERGSLTSILNGEPIPKLMEVDERARSLGIQRHEFIKSEMTTLPEEVVRTAKEAGNDKFFDGVAGETVERFTVKKNDEAASSELLKRVREMGGVWVGVRTRPFNPDGTVNEKDNGDVDYFIRWPKTNKPGV